MFESKIKPRKIKLQETKFENTSYKGYTGWKTRSIEEIRVVCPYTIIMEPFQQNHLVVMFLEKHPVIRVALAY